MKRTSDNPCRRHRCHECCLETRMTLTEADVDRLGSAGFEGFVRLNRDGDLELVNRNGRCVFLDGDRCGVYALRPEGCRLYPLVLDLAEDRIVLDRGCPHRLEFRVSEAASRRLRVSVKTEEGERRLRGSADG